MSKLAVFVVLAVGASAVRHWEVTADYSFERYVSDHHKVYTSAQEAAMRRTLFEVAKHDVLTHNAGRFSWKKTLNQFSDRTPAELKRNLGGMASAFAGYKPRSQQEYAAPELTSLPDSVDWRQYLTGVKDQGQCGSCWAFATTETIEAHVAIQSEFKSGPVLSPQQIVSCVPNTHDCGGTGGCLGGIPEIAYDYLRDEGGMTQEFNYPYTSYWGDSGKCAFHNGTSKGDTPPIATVAGFVKLPANNRTATMQALAAIGPLAINVAAMNWHSYDSGVFQGCTSTTTDIDHVVQLVGYGTDTEHGPYVLVRNSWSPTWGEGGYIRLANPETPISGTDHAPQDGTGCAGGPDSVTVTGPCGTFYDVSYPVGARFV